jgi:hypothetical protein
MQFYYDKDTDDDCINFKLLGSVSDTTSVDGLIYRPQTAPPSPISDLEEFKRFQFFNLT